VSNLESTQRQGSERADATEAGATEKTTGVAREPHADRARPSASIAKPGPEHKRLDAFAGTWRMRGRAYDSPFGKAADVSAVQMYEWLPGGMFLIHRLEGRLGDAPMACIEIIGVESGSGRYFAHTFYNDGNANLWRVREQDGGWEFSGEWKIESDTYRARCRITFDDGGDRRTAKWEYSRDGSSWKPFWDTEHTRI
jgi:hypothetical protein